MTVPQFPPPDAPPDAPDDGPLDDQDVPSPVPSTRGYPMSDIGNAERFVEHWGDTVHFVRAWGTWLRWDGRRWAPDETGAVERMAKATVRSIHGEALAAKSKAARAALSKHALGSEANKAIRAMLDRVKAEHGVTKLPGDFDVDPWTLNVANGLLDLRADPVSETVTLRDHDRRARCRKLIEIPYDPDAACPRWEAFLARIFGGDLEMIGYVQRAIGYSLTGLTGEQCLFFLYGRGANGKSTFLETLRHLGGEYAAQAEFSTLVERRSEGPRNDVARLERARVVTASELGEGKRLNEELAKSLTGGDTITARYMYRELFEFRPEFKLWLAANHKPVIRGTDDGIWRRIRLIPFEVQIPEAERDPALPDALRRELPGILAWAARGCVLWQREGLITPDAVREATQAYRQESDVIGAWIDEHCVIGPLIATHASLLYANYRRWAEQGGEHVLSQTAFGKRLTERGHRAEKVGSGKDRHTVRWGIGLTADAVVGSVTGQRSESSE